MLAECLHPLRRQQQAAVPAGCAVRFDYSCTSQQRAAEHVALLVLVSVCILFDVSPPGFCFVQSCAVESQTLLPAVITDGTIRIL